MTPAKVNLTLEVLGPRADGYHELSSVFATVDLRDRVRVAPWRELDVRIAPAVGVAPGDDLASRAVRA
ncbi:MAG: 4-(cytidine 5'-diphospho)-2-C-methyl-D-erythritol kinase, partial [Chloroflexota bacterium]|nr:4-(cytidine 5'-diphospho)-2-C-methyl-D-erythritol kinase [Chloroflexota bacterium]